MGMASIRRARCLYVTAALGIFVSICAPNAQAQADAASPVSALTQGLSEGSEITFDEIRARTSAIGCGQLIVANRQIRVASFAEYDATRSRLQRTLGADIAFDEKVYAHTFLRSITLYLCDDGSWVLAQGELPFDFDGTLGTRSARLRVLHLGDRASTQFANDPAAEQHQLFYGRMSNGRGYAIIREGRRGGDRTWWGGYVTDAGLELEDRGFDLYLGSEFENFLRPPAAQ